MGTLHYGFSPYWQQGLTYLLPLTESDQMLPARYSKMTLMSNFCKEFFCMVMFWGVLTLLATGFRAMTSPRCCPKKFVILKVCMYMV